MPFHHAKAFVAGALIIQVTVMPVSATEPAASSWLELGSKPFKPSDVKQAQLGCCYFYASLAAISQTLPGYLEGMLLQPMGRKYQVAFPNNRIEQVSFADVAYAKTKGFDQSPADWPVIFLRAYGQKVLRKELVDSARKATRTMEKVGATHSSSSTIAGEFIKWIEQSDLLLEIYDRSIRNAVNQDGDFDPEVFATTMEDKLNKVPLPMRVRTGILRLVHAEFLGNGLKSLMDKHGELFGVYRSVGNGGSTREALTDLLGAPAGYVDLASAEQVHQKLSDAALRGLPMVGSTREDAFTDLLSKGLLQQSDVTWYVENHAFTVLFYKPSERMVHLRNPWGSHPGNDGIFDLSLSDFMKVFSHLSIGKRP